MGDVGGAVVFLRVDGADCVISQAFQAQISVVGFLEFGSVCHLLYDLHFFHFFDFLLVAFKESFLFLCRGCSHYFTCFCFHIRLGPVRVEPVEEFMDQGVYGVDNGVDGDFAVFLNVPVEIVVLA